MATSIGAFRRDGDEPAVNDAIEAGARWRPRPFHRGTRRPNGRGRHGPACAGSPGPLLPVRRARLASGPGRAVGSDRDRFGPGRINHGEHLFGVSRSSREWSHTDIPSRSAGDGAFVTQHPGADVVVAAWEPVPGEPARGLAPSWRPRGAGPDRGEDRPSPLSRRLRSAAPVRRSRPVIRRPRRPSESSSMACTTPSAFGTFSKACPFAAG